MWNQDNPCNVGDLYNVETSYVENLRNVHNSQLEDMKELKHTMIHTKLNYLFGFTNEETTLSEFEILKTKMKNISKELKNTKDLYENVVVNKEKQDDIRNMDKVTKELIQKSNPPFLNTQIQRMIPCLPQLSKYIVMSF